MARRRRPLTPAKLAVRTFQYATLVVASFLVLAPLYSVLVGSLKSPLEYINTSKMTPPANWLNFDHYAAVLFPNTGLPIGNAFLNSAIVIVCSIVLLIIFGAMLSFVLARFKFPGRGL